jgi:HK97 family phage portal protein
LAGAALKAASISFIPEWVRYSVFYPAFANLIAEGYKANAAVSACIRVLAFSFPEPPLMTWQEGKSGLERDPSHPLRALLERPNPDMGEAEFWQFVITYMAIGGNCYIWLQPDRSGRPTAMWPLHDGQVKPVPGRNTAEGLVSWYALDIGDGSSGNPFGVENYDASVPGIALDKKDIVHIKWMIDPAQPWLGIGPIALAAQEVDTDNEVSRYIFSLLKNDAMPQVVITLVEDADTSPETIKRLRADWKQKYGGSKRGEPAFLTAGMKVERLALDLTQLAYEALNKVPESRICANFGVSPIVAHLTSGLERSTFANYGEARQALAEDTLVPLWRLVASEQQQAFELWYPGVKLAHDLEVVRSLQDNSDDVWNRARGAFNDGLATRAEARSMVGLIAGPGDEVYKESMTWALVPVGQSRPLLGAGDGPDSADSQNGDKALPAFARKQTGREFGQKVVDALRAVRLMSAGRMEAAVENYFERLAGRVVERAGKGWPTEPIPGMEWNFEANAWGVFDPNDGKWGRWTTIKILPSATDLLTGDDNEEFERLIKRFFMEVMAASWDTLGIALDSRVQFDANDPLVTAVLEKAGERVREINQATLADLRTLLQRGNELGLSIDALVDGVPDEGIRGLRDFVAETYKGRARTIARTELGTAQNEATVGRYEAAGVRKVLVFDNGLTDDDQPCIDANGAVWTLERARANPLSHPNCSRAFAPYFE